MSVTRTGNSWISAAPDLGSRLPGLHVALPPQPVDGSGPEQPLQEVVGDARRHLGFLVDVDPERLGFDQAARCVRRCGPASHTSGSRCPNTSAASAACRGTRSGGSGRPWCAGRSTADGSPRNPSRAAGPGRCPGCAGRPRPSEAGRCGRCHPSAAAIRGRTHRGGRRAPASFLCPGSRLGSPFPPRRLPHSYPGMPDANHANDVGQTPTIGHANSANQAFTPAGTLS